MVSRLGEGHMPGTFFLSEPQLKTTVRRFLYENYSELSNLRAKLGGFVYDNLQWYLIMNEKGSVYPNKRELQFMTLSFQLCVAPVSTYTQLAWSACKIERKGNKAMNHI